MQKLYIPTSILFPSSDGSGRDTIATMTSGVKIVHEFISNKDGYDRDYRK
jgi:hypothetical protein